MKILITGKNARGIAELVKSLALPAGPLRREASRQGFKIVTSDPDVIISYGGDGTLLASERKYPGVPKLPIRDSSTYKKCSDHKEEILLKGLLEKKLQIEEYKKLETTIFYQTLYALNDFVIRNAEPIHTIRFKVTAGHPERAKRVEGSINNQLLIGDGVVVSTPFGSTGYFKSVTGQTFEEGWGLAFNNTTEKIPPVFFKDEDIVTFKLVRGTATLSFDNNPDIFKLDEGSELIFKLSNQKAKIYEADSLRCPNCKVTLVSS